MESDRIYFDRHRKATSRVRFPFPNELRRLPVALDVPAGHDVAVIVAVQRSKATGAVVRARWFVFVPVGSSMPQ